MTHISSDSLCPIRASLFQNCLESHAPRSFSEAVRSMKPRDAKTFSHLKKAQAPGPFLKLRFLFRQKTTEVLIS